MAPDAGDLSHFHDPVMVDEVLAHLVPDASVPGGVFVDGTVGAGGHAEAVLRHVPDATLLCLDRDPRAVALATERLAPFGARAQVRHASYAHLDTCLSEAGLEAPRGILLDVGVSSMQIDDPERGFSFRAEDALPDMRFDPTSERPTAADWLNHADEREIADALHLHGEEPRARAVARAIVRARPIRSVGELAQVVRRHALRIRRIDPATRTFQAIRIVVNEELAHFEQGLAVALDALAPGGRLVLLCFQSGEERRVKAAFREAVRKGQGAVLTRSPIRASTEETRRNPRARPARLRAFARHEVD